MKNKLFGFTLSEMMIVFFVIGVIASASMALYRAQLNIAKKYTYYAAFINLERGVGEIVAEGTTKNAAAPPPNDLVLEALLPTVANQVYTTAFSDGKKYTTNNGFCQRFSDYVNVIDVAGISCTKTSTTAGPFNETTANFIVSNGVRYFNFGTNPVLDAALPDLPENYYYDIFVDINGSAGSGVLDNDIMRFKIYRSGQVVPWVDSLGGTSSLFMTASAKYNDGAGDVYPAAARGVPYLDAACFAGIVTGTNCPAGKVKTEPCISNTCSVSINVP